MVKNPGARPEKLVVAGLRGFCAGVVRAIDVVEKALAVCDGPVYVRKEIIHNRYVVEDLRRKGAKFVEEVEDAPDGAWLIYSAHGVSPEVRENARRRGLRTIDATCPLVTKVHLEALHYAKNGYTILLIGNEGHDETVGTSGKRRTPSGSSAPGRRARRRVPDPARVAYLTQSDPLHGRHPRDRRDAPPAVSADGESCQGRHLLRHAEPAGRRRNGSRDRSPAGARRAEQLQFDPACARFRSAPAFRRT